MALKIPYLMPTFVIPCTKYFCSATNRMIVGTVISVDIAMSCCHSTPTSSVIMARRPVCTVRSSMLLVMISGHR